MKAQTEKQRLGILGLGNRSTLFYIDELNKRYNKQHAEYSTFPFLLYNSDFSLLNPYLPNDFKKLVPQLTTYLKELEGLGVTHLLILNITLHETLDKMDCRLSVIHPITIAIKMLKEKNATEAVVFGSGYTMQSDYLRSKFLEEGIKLISPTEDEMALIDQMRRQVYYQKESQEGVDKYRELLKSYTSRTSVLLACTELSVVNFDTDSRVVDMALCQIDAAVALYS